MESRNTVLKNILESKEVIGLPSFLLFYSFLSGTYHSKIVVLPETEIRQTESLLELFQIPYSTLPSFFLRNEEPLETKLELTRFLFDFLQNNEPRVFLIPAEYIFQKIIKPKNFQDSLISYSLNQEISQSKMIEQLISSGYVCENKTITPGTFSVRGEIVEIFPAQLNEPVRIEIPFNTIDSITTYDPLTGKSNSPENTVVFSPLSVTFDSGYIYDYLNLHLTLFHTTELFELHAEETEHLIDPLSDGYYSEYESLVQSKRHAHYSFETSETECAIQFQPTDFIVSTEALQETLSSIKTDTNFTKIIFCNEKNVDSITSLFNHHAIDIEIKKYSQFIQSVSSPAQNVTLFSYPASQKLTLHSFKEEMTAFWVMQDSDFIKKRHVKKRRKKVDEAFIASLKPGDFVVHIDHGVGKFLHTTKREIDAGIREFFVIEYLKGDKIYLPVEYADKIAKYIGEAVPRVNRLHEVSFKKIKGQIKEDAEKVAKELLELQAMRESRKGFSYPKPAEEDSFLKSFPFTDTECQHEAWLDVQKDLEGEKPMDRLLCGDVGFGKTEVSMRAAFRVAKSKRQVAVLAPTTILAKQHFQNFQSRFKDFNVKTALLSRLQTPSEQKKILEQALLGEVDILIGTHRLLSKDVSFSNLGLIIVDEEQRFGVKAKERLKQMRNNTDILTMTATPIPRTLHMSLSGLRDISTLTTAPEGRIPVETRIQKFNDSKIKQAVEFELERNGQVFYLHNRVQTIHAAERKIKKLVPRARTAIVHGQLSPQNISEVMKDFEEGKTNVLICSSIIENGIDIPTVNTLIVADAIRFGLGQLYQLRGRVGRGSSRGYSYFFYNVQKLTDVAKKRLAALRAAKKLGSGFEIAMKDLEIRGAGNILGKEQSGKVKAIGLSHYVRLLNTAVEEIKSGKKHRDVDVSIDLPINAFIPEDVIEDEQERLRLYQKLASITDIKELQKEREDLLADTDIPEFSHLFYILELKLLAHNAFISQVDSKSYFHQDGSEYKKIVINFEEKTDYEKAYAALQTFPFLEVEETKIKFPLSALGSNWQDHLKEIVKVFE